MKPWQRQSLDTISFTHISTNFTIKLLCLAVDKSKRHRIRIVGIIVVRIAIIVDIAEVVGVVVVRRL